MKGHQPEMLKPQKFTPAVTQNVQLSTQLSDPYQHMTSKCHKVAARVTCIDQIDNISTELGLISVCVGVLALLI